MLAFIKRLSASFAVCCDHEEQHTAIISLFHLDYPLTHDGITYKTFNSPIKTRYRKFFSFLLFPNVFYYPPRQLRQCPVKHQERTYLIYHECTYPFCFTEHRLR